MNKIFLSESKDKTKKLGQILSKYLLPGDVLFINGNLGAGKSELVRGIGIGLGIVDAIPSPSFTILNAYENINIPLYHFDWYRVSYIDELYEIGIEDYLYGNGISCIEWSSLFANDFSNLKYILINIERQDNLNENYRTITIDTSQLLRNINLEDINNEYISI